MKRIWLYCLIIGILGLLVLGYWGMSQSISDEPEPDIASEVDNMHLEAHKPNYSTGHRPEFAPTTSDSPPPIFDTDSSSMPMPPPLGPARPAPPSPVEINIEGSGPVDNIPQPHAQMAHGRLLLNWPGQLKVNESYLLHLIVACNQPFSKLNEQLDQLMLVEADTNGQHRQTHTAEQIELGRSMRAELTRTGTDTNDSMLMIVREPTGETGIRTLNLKTDTTVSWSWYLTPKEPGRIDLTVSLTRLDAGITKVVYHYPITIVGKEPSTLEKITGFLTGANTLWTLLSTGIVGTIIKYLVDHWPKKKESQTN